MFVNLILFRLIDYIHSEAYKKQQEEANQNVASLTISKSEPGMSTQQQKTSTNYKNSNSLNPTEEIAHVPLKIDVSKNNNNINNTNSNNNNSNSTPNDGNAANTTTLSNTSSAMSPFAKIPKKKEATLYHEDAVKLYKGLTNSSKRYEKGIALTKACHIFSIAWELDEDKGRILPSKIVRHFKQVLPSKKTAKKKKKNKNKNKLSNNTSNNSVASLSMNNSNSSMNSNSTPTSVTTMKNNTNSNSNLAKIDEIKENPDGTFPNLSIEQDSSPVDSVDDNGCKTPQQRFARTPVAKPTPHQANKPELSSRRTYHGKAFDSNSLKDFNSNSSMGLVGIPLNNGNNSHSNGNSNINGNGNGNGNDSGINSKSVRFNEKSRSSIAKTELMIAQIEEIMSVDDARVKVKTDIEQEFDEKQSKNGKMRQRLASPSFKLQDPSDELNIGNLTETDDEDDDIEAQRRRRARQEENLNMTRANTIGATTSAAMAKSIFSDKNSNLNGNLNEHSQSGRGDSVSPKSYLSFARANTNDSMSVSAATEDIE